MRFANFYNNIIEELAHSDEDERNDATSMEDDPHNEYSSSQGRIVPSRDQAEEGPSSSTNRSKKGARKTKKPKNAA